jgi:5'-deoxynucleotidase YfbR-like HD superfamily hydrolase
MGGVDQKCWDLAEYFLSDIKGHKKEDIQELAEELQQRCEDACQTIEADEGGRSR